MKRSSSSGLDKSVHFEEVSAIASNRGDVGMLVRSMGSDWIQKGRLLSETDSGLGDSGAQISVTNVATAAKFGLKRRQYDIPIQIGFAQGAEVMAMEYVLMGSVLGKVPVLEAETIFSLWSICDNGYEVILDRDQIRVRDKVSGKIVYEGGSSPANKEWRIDTQAMLCLEASESHQSALSLESSAMVRADKLLIRDRGDVVETKSRRGAPRITQRIKNAIIWMHNCLCHRASPGAIAAALRNGEAWSGVDVEFTAAMVEKVFQYHTCVVCQIAKWNSPAVGIGSGVDVNLPGHTVYMDVVTGVNPPSNHGNTGFYYACDNCTGMQFFFPIRTVHEFEGIVRKMHAYFKKHGHRMVTLVFDAARFENSEANRKIYDDLLITPRIIEPEQQRQNRAERSIQTFVKCLCAVMIAQSYLCAVYWEYAGQAVVSADRYIVNVHSAPLTPVERVENKGAPDVFKICKFPFGCPTVHVRVGKKKLGPYGKRWVSKNVFGYAVGPDIDTPGSGATRIIIPGTRHAVNRKAVQHCHVQHQQHLMTASEIERIGDELVAQLIKENGTLVFKSPSADLMGRDNSALVTDDLMGLQLPPIRAPALVTETIAVEDQALGGAETAIEAQVNEEYGGDAESEDEASVADDEDGFGPDDLESEVDIDMSDSRPKTTALEERIRAEPRVPRFNYVSLIRNRSDGISKRVLVRRLRADQELSPRHGGVQDWLEQQSCKFGHAGLKMGSNARVDCAADLQEVVTGSSRGGIERVRALMWDSRTERA